MKTFRNFLDEARRNPISKKTGKELNPKIPLYDKLEPLANDSDVYITYVADVGSMSKSAEGFKIGINPNSEYNTPNGIYSYPLKESGKNTKILLIKLWMFHLLANNHLFIFSNQKLQTRLLI